MTTTIPIWERGVEGGRSRPIDCELLGSMLCEIGAVLTKHGMRHCLLFGTLLGAYRDGALIPWDDDVDLGVFTVDRAKLARVAKSLRSRGYRVLLPGDPKQPVSNENMPYYDTVFIKHGEKIELWWFDKRPDCYIYDEARCGNSVRYARRYFDTFDQVSFLGQQWNIPAHPEEWLAETYGADWQTPIKGRKPLSH